LVKTNQRRFSPYSSGCSQRPEPRGGVHDRAGKTVDLKAKKSRFQSARMSR
jgi:hypothetical protein